jgi:hypothetical protein
MMERTKKMKIWHASSNPTKLGWFREGDCLCSWSPNTVIQSNFVMTQAEFELCCMTSRRIMKTQKWYTVLFIYEVETRIRHSLLFHDAKALIILISTLHSLRKHVKRSIDDVKLQSVNLIVVASWTFIVREIRHSHAWENHIHLNHFRSLFLIFHFETSNFSISYRQIFETFDKFRLWCNCPIMLRLNGLASAVQSRELTLENYSSRASKWKHTHFYQSNCLCSDEKISTNGNFHSLTANHLNILGDFFIKSANLRINLYLFGIVVYITYFSMVFSAWAEWWPASCPNVIIIADFVPTSHRTCSVTSVHKSCIFISASTFADAVRNYFWKFLWPARQKTGQMMAWSCWWDSHKLGDCRDFVSWH